MKQELIFLILGSILLVGSLVSHSIHDIQVIDQLQETQQESSSSSSQMVQNSFSEVIARRTQTSQHYYNPALNTYKFKSNTLVYKENVIEGTNWVTFEEYPLNYILRLRNGSIRTFSTTQEITNYFAVIDNSTLWGLGIESYSGIFGFYLNLQDTFNGHGQYLYYPRLRNGRLPAFNQPLYAIYPHLFAKVGVNWYDQLLNNRSLYNANNNPRNNLHFTSTTTTLEIFFKTNDITIQNFQWDFTHGLKFNTTTRQFHMITRFRCLDRGFDDLGIGYEITASPQSENTPYEPEGFVIGNDTHEVYVNVSQAWTAGTYLENFYSHVEIISENKEGFRFNFEDMEEVGFTNKYLSLQDLELPNFETRKTLRAGMYGYGSYLQNNWIEIDPSYSAKQTIDEQDFQTRYVPPTYTLSTGMDHFRVGVRSVTSIYRGFITFNTTITETIQSITQANATIYVYDNYLGGSDSIYFGYYYNTTLYGGFWNETYGQSYDEDVHIQTTEWNDTWQIGTSMGNVSLPTTELGYCMDNWTVTHNVDPTERKYIAFKYWEGPGIVGDEWFRVYESSYVTASRRPTLEFLYTVGVPDPPELDSPSDKVLDYGFSGENITWLPTERTNSPDKYVVYRNGSHFANGSWTNQTDIVIDIDSINTTTGAHNFTIVINDTSDLSANDTVWVTVGAEPTTTTTTTTTTTVTPVVPAEEYINIKDHLAREDIPLTIQLFNLQQNIIYRVNSTFNSIGKWLIASALDVHIIYLELNAPEKTYDYITVYLYFNDSELVDNKTILYIDNDYYRADDFFSDNLPTMISFVVFGAVFIAIPLVFFEKVVNRRRY